MVERQPSKLNTGVQFPSSAPAKLKSLNSDFFILKSKKPFILLMLILFLCFKLSKYPHIKQ
jgi:hypothetical protein